MKYLIAIVVLLLCVGVRAQEIFLKPRTVPIGMATYKNGTTYIKVTYGRPTMVTELTHPFGSEQVPWRELWRTGDDDATEMTVTSPVTFAEKPLAAGTYTLFTIPDTTQWQVMLNTEPGQWGIYTYDSLKNVVVTQVSVYRSPKVVQTFTIYLEPRDYGADLVLIWDRESISIPIMVAQPPID